MSLHCTQSCTIYTTITPKLGTHGGVMVKALRYKLAGHGFDSPGVDSASNRNEYQVYFLVVKVAGV